MMDDMDTGSISASGSENRELSEEDVALSPPPIPVILVNPSNCPLKIDRFTNVNESILFLYNGLSFSSA